MPRTLYDDPEAEDNFQRSNTDARSTLGDRAGVSGAGAARAQQDHDERIVNNYQSLYMRSNASSMKAYQQATKALVP